MSQSSSQQQRSVGGTLGLIAVSAVISTATLFFLEAKLTAQPQPPEAPQLLSQEMGDKLALHPDEPEAVTLTTRFSVTNALERTQQIQGALDSFRQLTTAVESGTGVDMTEFDHTDWETQNLGFYNWVGAVEGTLRHQDWRIQQLEYELAQKQFEDGEMSAEVFEQKTADYQQAKQSFQQFLDGFAIAD